jgi:bifunctional DNA-binding transcriptional regulator/antitoxin component of YhaV-PrlF toxin-antitoxin module
MRIAKVTSGGQLSIPAAVRKRWGTSRVAIDDQGDRLVVTPLPDDPISAARGVFRGRIASSSDLRETARRDEAAAASRRR